MITSVFNKEKELMGLIGILLITGILIIPELIYCFDFSGEQMKEVNPETKYTLKDLSFTDSILLKVRGAPKERENVVYCPVCGHLNGINTRNCVYCGAVLLKEDNEGKLYRYCIYCGYNNPPDAAECKNCHYDFSQPRSFASLSELIWRKSYALNQEDIESNRRIMTISPITIACGAGLILALGSKINEPATGMLKFVGMSAITIGIMQFITSNIEYRFNMKNIEDLRKTGILSGYIK